MHDAYGDGDIPRTLSCSILRVMCVCVCVCACVCFLFFSGSSALTCDFCRILSTNLMKELSSSISASMKRYFLLKITFMHDKVRTSKQFINIG